MITFLFVALLLLGILFLGLPVAFGLGGTAWLLIILFDLPTELIIQTLYTSMDSFVLLAVPLYVLMSQILLEGKIGDDLFEVMNVWVRHLPGGLAIATILACAFFAAITGSGAANAATIGLVAYPAMVARGYDKKFTLGLLAAGGTLGILIPPSIPMILYGAVTEESVGKLFMGGVIPGIVMACVFILYAIFRTLRKGYIPIPKAPWKERFTVTQKNLAGIFLPFLIVGGIYTGIFTPTEAAAVGLVYSLFITLILYRTLTVKDLPRICLKAFTTSSMIALIIAGALLFGKVMTMIEIPQLLTEWIIKNNLTPMAFILAMNVLMFFLGMMLETISIILLTMPLVAPVLSTLEIDPIWYGIILTVNLTLALVTPPVGMDLYVIAGLQKDVHISEVIQGVFPFILLMIGVLALVIAFPALSTWLPSVMR